MNVKKMTTEHLRAEITILENEWADRGGLTFAEGDFLNACKKELKRRWGIKG